MADYGLAAKAINCGAEGLVEIHASKETPIFFHAVNPRSENNSLHDVAGAEAPDLARKHDVVGAVNLGPVIPGAGQPGKGKLGATAAVCDFEEAFRDIDVRGAVFSHGAEFHKMCLRANVTHGVQQIKGRCNVICLHEDRMVHVDHRVGRRRAFAEMHNTLRPKLAENGLDKLVVAKVARPESQLLAVSHKKSFEALFHGANRCSAPRAHLFNPFATKQDVGARDRVPPPCEM